MTDTVNLTVSASEPIPYNCPGCGANYHVVTVDGLVDAQHDRGACRWCGIAFPAREGANFLRYLPRPPYLRHKSRRETDD